MSIFPGPSSCYQQPVAKERREERSIIIPSVPLTPHKMEDRNTVSYKHELSARKHLNSQMHTIRR